MWPVLYQICAGRPGSKKIEPITYVITSSYKTWQQVCVSLTTIISGLLNPYYITLSISSL